MLALLARAGVPLPEDAVIHRTNASRHQRINGAWMWRVETTGHSLPAHQAARIWNGPTT